ncbi:unnamed protein product [Closterium sp. NIES-65]|nr:unnamed protein product [Closterium sp. NIES-65]
MGADRRPKNPVQIAVWWLKKQPPKIKAFLGVCIGIAALIFLRFMVVDHDNLFVAAEAIHAIGIGVLVYKLTREKNCAGLSLKSQELTAIFLAVRLYCSMMMEKDIHTLLDLATLVTTAWVIYTMRFQLRSTLSEDLDNLAHVYILAPCAILALLVHPRTSHFIVNRVLWAFCVYLEAVSVLPQLRVMQNAKVSAGEKLGMGEEGSALGIDEVGERKGKGRGSPFCMYLEAVSVLPQLRVMQNAKVSRGGEAKGREEGGAFGIEWALQGGRERGGPSYPSFLICLAPPTALITPPNPPNSVGYPPKPPLIPRPPTRLSCTAFLLMPSATGALHTAPCLIALPLPSLSLSPIQPPFPCPHLGASHLCFARPLSHSSSLVEPFTSRYLVEPFTAHYVFALGIARFLSCAHWILQVMDGHSFIMTTIGYGMWPAMVLLSEIVQTFILADFCYYYVRSVMEGQLMVFVIPASASPLQRRIFLFLQDKCRIPGFLLVPFFWLSPHKWLLVILWFIAAPLLQIYFELGPLFILGTCFALIFFNLGTRQQGEASAYSIFNEGFQELPGTLNAQRLDEHIRAGQF